MASGSPSDAPRASEVPAVDAAGAAAWRWDPRERRLHLQGAVDPLGLAGLRASGRLEALVALATPDGRRKVEDAFAPGARPGPLRFSLRLRTGQTGHWRGARREDGAASGLVWPADEAATEAAGPLDPLTGLLGRAGFLQALEARLRSSGAPVRLVTADLMRFRRLNEGLGPERADHVLAAMGGRLAGVAPPEHLPARVGEDEFALLAPAEDEGAAAAVRAALETPMRLHGVDIHPKVAMGEAVSAPGDDASELLRRAAVARPGGRPFDPEAPPAEAATGARIRLELESDVRGALERGEMVPFYQPIVRLRDARVAGFEALVRWRHPRLGLLPPDEFLPLVLEAGVMPELSLFMIESAAAQIARWRIDHPRAGPITVGVNVTCGDLERPNLVERVRACLQRNKLPKHALKLELTEGEIMRDPEGSAAVLQALQQIGTALAVDDFGMGFSSLSYLARLPLQQLKIDRYFVRTMDVNEGSAKIVRSVVGLSRDLGLEIVAEGVEDAPMAAKLAEIGCHYGQGFGYARPLPAQEAEVYLNESYLDGAPLRATA